MPTRRNNLLVFIAPPPVEAFLPVTESTVLSWTLGYLQGHGHLTWRNNTGAGRFQNVDRAGNLTGNARFVRFNVPGASDVFSIVQPYGVFLAVEVKKENKQPTREQEEFLIAVRNAGGHGIWVRPSNYKVLIDQELEVIHQKWTTRNG